MPCLYCYRLHVDICQMNPDYLDGEDDMKVSSYSYEDE